MYYKIDFDQKIIECFGKPYVKHCVAYYRRMPIVSLKLNPLETKEN